MFRETSENIGKEGNTLDLDLLPGLAWWEFRGDSAPTPSFEPITWTCKVGGPLFVQAVEGHRDGLPGLLEWERPGHDLHQSRKEAVSNLTAQFDWNMLG